MSSSEAGMDGTTTYQEEELEQLLNVELDEDEQESSDAEPEYDEMLRTIEARREG